MKTELMRAAPGSIRTLLLAGAAAVLVSGAAAAPANADDEWRGRREWRDGERRYHEGREHDWREHEWREHVWRERFWRPDYSYYGYYGYPPAAIYAPPPTYYVAPPVAGLSFVFPLR
jgi:hypothetical protein